MLKQQKGMTLTILVLSIVAVLALAAIAIAMVLDELSYDVQIYTEQQVENNDKAVVIDNGTTDVTEVTENAE